MGGQLQSMGVANVRFNLKNIQLSKEKGKQQEEIKALQNKVQGITKTHVSYISCNSQLAADVEELTSAKVQFKTKF